MGSSLNLWNFISSLPELKELELELKKFLIESSLIL